MSPKQKAKLRATLKTAWTLAHQSAASSDLLSAIEAALAALENA